MKPIAITVSVNYSDFFCWSALSNHSLFKEWIIVTTPDDYMTQSIARMYNLKLLVTDKLTEGSRFNKWAGINEALKLIPKSEWVLFLDSDIVLPRQHTRVLESLILDTNTLYGIDRLDCKGLSSLIKYIESPLIYNNNWLLTNGGMEIGARIVHLYGQENENGMFGGYKPLGYYQLAHRSSFDSYPDTNKTAAHCDIQFANMYPRSQRVLIPELFGIHLMSDNAEWGSNWLGRTTNLFNNNLTY